MQISKANKFRSISRTDLSARHDLRIDRYSGAITSRRQASPSARYVRASTTKSMRASLSEIGGRKFFVHLIAGDCSGIFRFEQRMPTLSLCRGAGFCRLSEIVLGVTGELQNEDL